MAICRICKEDLGDIHKISLDDCVLIGGSAYYHELCYKNREVISKKLDQDTVNTVISEGKERLAERIHKAKNKQEQQKERQKTRQENQEERQKQQQERKKFNTERKEFFDWVQENYSMDFLSGLFFTKIASVVNGTHRGLSEPIPYPDLLDMFQRKKKQFDIKFAYKEFNSSYNRFCYDLSVIMSQYNSYKNWKITRELELESIQNNMEFGKRIASSKSVASMVKTNHQEDTVDPIANAMDDIFG